MSISNETIKEFQLALEAERGCAVDEKEAEAILFETVAYIDTLAMIDFRKEVQVS